MTSPLPPKRPSLLDLEPWQEIVQSMRRSPWRTLLTSGGVFWGMLMLVLMLGFGQGMEISLTKKMWGSAKNIAWVYGRQTSMPYAGFQPGRRIVFTNSDANVIGALPEVKAVAPRIQLGGWRSGNIVKHANRQASLNVMGEVPDYLEVSTLQMVEGRFINPLDLQHERKVAVIGSQVITEIYDPNDAVLGSELNINGVIFTVVGHYTVPGSGERAARSASFIHVPLTTFQKVYHMGDKVGWMNVAGHDEVPATVLGEQIRATLGRIHNIHPGDNRAIGSGNSQEEYNRLTKLFTGVRAFVWFVGLAMLLSGIIGVSNILLIAVRERTPEIGLRRALGASRIQVILHILREALVLTSAAGYLGLLLGVAFLQVARSYVGYDHAVLGPPGIDLPTALLALTVLTLAGLLAGVLPAQKAASIEPVVALRTE